MRILVVEDEVVTATYLDKGLSSLGFISVGVARTADDAVFLAQKETPDLVLMDISLQGKETGIDAAEVISLEMDIPVVFLTAYTDREHLDRAKEVRPYGYIVKPFTLENLRAQLEIAYERYRETQSDTKPQKNHFYFNDTCWFERDTKRFIKDEQEYKLTRKELNLLELLIDQKGAVLTHDYIQNTIWGECDLLDYEKSMRTLVWRLRGRLPSKSMLVTVSGVGYKLKL